MHQSWHLEQLVAIERVHRMAIYIYRSMVYICWLGLHEMYQMYASTEKRERAWYLFSHEWRQDRKNGKKGLIVHGCTGPRTPKRASVAGNLLHVSSQRRAIVIYTERWACSRLNNMQNAACLFWKFPIRSCSCEKRYQALTAFPYCKRRKAGLGLGMRLDFLCGRCWCMFWGLCYHKKTTT